MPRITWKPEIATGHLIQIAVMLVTLTAIYVKLEATVEHQDVRISLIEKKLVEGEIAREQIKASVTSERIRQTEILAEMRGDLRYLKQAIDEIRRPALKMNTL